VLGRSQRSSGGCLLGPNIAPDFRRRASLRLREELPGSLAGLDKDIADLVDGYLGVRAIKYRRSDGAGRAVFDIASDAVLPIEVGKGRRFATGDARGLTNAESLNLGHPLVRAAISHAQAWAGDGSVTLHLPAGSSPELLALAGKAGVMRVVMVHYAGFEPVQRLIAAAVIDGAPIDPLLAAQLMRLKATEEQTPNAPVDTQWLPDAVEEAVFVDQRQVEEGEQKHFEQAIGQLERFVEDKILVCRRERVGIAEKLRAARKRRDEIVGSSARERVEAEIIRLATKDESLDRHIRALESREDEVYRKWRDEYHELRYRTPTVLRLFQSAFQILAPNPETSC
jgi:hypothetical protein